MNERLKLFLHEFKTPQSYQQKNFDLESMMTKKQTENTKYTHMYNLFNLLPQIFKH